MRGSFPVIFKICSANFLSSSHEEADGVFISPQSLGNFSLNFAGDKTTFAQQKPFDEGFECVLIKYSMTETISSFVLPSLSKSSKSLLHLMKFGSLIFGLIFFMRLKKREVSSSLSLLN